MSRANVALRGVAVGGVVLAAAALLAGPQVSAQPNGPATFCEVYPDAPACAAGEVSCDTCHTSPPSLNVYGVDVSTALVPGEGRPLTEDLFHAGLPDALVAVEDVDSDLDAYSNIEEILAGSSPSDAGSAPVAEDCEDRIDDGYQLCGYDIDYTYKKVMLDFCGRSPSLAEREAFADAGRQQSLLHEALDECLDSEHWRGIEGRVWNLANRKIGPQQAVKAGDAPGPIPLADYDDDYAYFVWTQTDGRDARLVLTGTTYAAARYEGGQTIYEEWDRSPREDNNERGFDVYQAVPEERRAGLLTHRWFLMSNTMFTGVPRTTAAQAYRAFLGYDLARLEGLAPVAGEPVDYDSKGVAADGCATCHSTLDPLTYPFSRYNGISDGSLNYNAQYTYLADRMESYVAVDGELVAETPEAGVLFGEPVANLVEWAAVAANSDAFRKATVHDYWEMLLGETPRATEQAEFSALAEALSSEHGYSIESMLHDLIDTEAYGAP